VLIVYQLLMRTVLLIFGDMHALLPTSNCNMACIDSAAEGHKYIDSMTARVHALVNDESRCNMCLYSAWC